MIGRKEEVKVERLMKLWNKKTPRRKLGILINGETAFVTPTEESNPIDSLDKEVQKITEVFKCLSRIDKSVKAFDEKHISITLQCKSFCPLSNKTFCRDVVNLMGKELTEKMLIETWVDKGGFIDYSKH